MKQQVTWEETKSDSVKYDRDQYNQGYADGKAVGYALALKEYGISEKKLYADSYDYDRCYYSGEYNEQYCGECPYKDNCSGSDDWEDD